MSKPLTNREINLYRGVYWLATLLWISALLFYFLLGDRAFDATLIEICLIAMNTMVMFGFGTALRSGTRIIYGIPWLLDDRADRKAE